MTGARSTAESTGLNSPSDFPIGTMGPFARIRSVLFSPHPNHRMVIRLMTATMLALLIAYSIGVSGGMVTVIAVLFMPTIPHSIFLACGRFIFAVVGCGMGWILGNQFAETPLILFAILVGNSLFFYYLLAKGLPVFIMILMSLMPIGFAWLVIAGKPSSVAQQVLTELLCGVFAMEAVSLLWPDHALHKLRTGVGGALCRFSQTYARMFRNSDPSSLVRPTYWRASTNIAFNTTMLHARSEVGSRNKELRRLIGIVDQVRHILCWPDMLFLLFSGGKSDKWATDLSSERRHLHGCIKEATNQIGSAICERKSPLHLEMAHDSMRQLDVASCDWMKKNRGDLDLEQISIIYARCDLGHEMNSRFDRISSILQSHPRDLRETLDDIPPTVFGNVKKGFDGAAGLFALKATVSVFISFMIGLIYLDWKGCLILVLLSGFLAPLSFGGLTATFIDRVVGLVLAGTVALACILLVIPDINDVGVFLVVLGVVTYPFWLLATNPLTAGLGLSSLMALFYILTGSFDPSASLSPVETRVLAVAGATLVSYLVFLLFMPVTGLQIVSSRVDAVLSSISRIAAFTVSKERDSVENEDDLRILTHESVHALASFDQLVSDLRWELPAHDRYARIRQKLLKEFTLLVPLVINCVNVGIRIQSTQTSEFIALRMDMKNASTEFLKDLSRYSFGPQAGSFSLEPSLVKCIEAHENLGAYLNENGYADRAIFEDDGNARVALIYHAYHRIIIRRVRVIRRLMVLRLEESRRVRAKTVARTA